MRKLISAAAAMVVMLSTAQAGQIWLTMDYVRPYKLERPATDIIIGNPAIADITVQDASNILFFGKTPGITNIYILDENGETIENLIVRVRTNTTDLLTLHEGSSRTTYNCTTNCDATITVGDDPGTFGQVTAQVTQKFGQAAASANAASDQ
jgi:Flp pilus assembly secretin CpaC